eukprot:11092363-Lingulodinium_polyedra.AAC.1
MEKQNKIHIGKTTFCQSHKHSEGCGRAQRHSEGTGRLSALYHRAATAFLCQEGQEEPQGAGQEAGVREMGHP